MIWPAIFLLAVIVGGFTTHLQARRADAAEARARRAWADHLDACKQRTVAEAEAATYLRRIGEIAADKAHAVIRADNLASEVTWLRGNLAAVEIDRDIHTAHHCCLPTLDGIRAYDFSGQPIVHATETTNVTSIKKRERS